MLQQASDYFVQLLEDQWFGKLVIPTIPDNWYVCMFLAAPDLADVGGAEPVGNGYVRLLIPNTSAYFAAAVSRQKNAAGVSYPLPWFTASGSFGPIVATGLRDAASGGKLILLYPIPVLDQQSIAGGNKVVFNQSDFSWRID